MKTPIKFVAGAALLMLGASAAGAQQATNYDLMMTRDGDNMMIHSRAGGEPMKVVPGENGQRPGQCDNGTFYSRGDNSVASCQDDTVYSMMAPSEGMMMDDGKPFAEGTMLLAPQDESAATTAPGATQSADQPLEPYAPSTTGSNK